MSNIDVLLEIIEELEIIARVATDQMIIAAANANLIKYKHELKKEQQANALGIIEYEIAHLVKKLK